MNTTVHQDLIYRSATLHDIEQLKKLSELSYGIYQETLTPENWEKLKTNVNTTAMWNQLIGASQSFLCIHHQHIIGMAFLVPSGNAWDIFPDDWAYIRMVGVDPQFHGMGIAGILTDMCVQHARANKEKTIALHTSEIMPAAQHIYRKAGFIQQQEIPQRLGVRYWMYTLEL